MLISAPILNYLINRGCRFILDNGLTNGAILSKVYKVESNVIAYAIQMLITTKGILYNIKGAVVIY